MRGMSDAISPYDGVSLYLGDCRQVLRGLGEGSVDAVVCDPPYGLEFMGKEWDKLTRNLMNADNTADLERKEQYGDSYQGRRSNLPDYTGSLKYANEMQAWHQEWVTECLRVLRPGGFFLAFGGSRTYHRLAAAAEDAGLILHDQLMWVYGSGFPKSLDVGKAMDKKLGATRTVVGSYTTHDIRKGGLMDKKGSLTVDVTVPTTDSAKQWTGWGTALKPAHEPIVLATRPSDVPLTDTALGTGDAPKLFYGAKAGRKERNYGLDGLPMKKADTRSAVAAGIWEKMSAPHQNHHPTVKPLDLMRHLVSVATPVGGVVLDPFTGSGSTGIAAVLEGRQFIGVEQDAEYLSIAAKRISAWGQKPR